MLKRIEKEAFKLFVQKIKTGHMISMDELKKLDHVQKREYIKIRMQFDENMKDYIK